MEDVNDVERHTLELNLIRKTEDNTRVKQMIEVMKDSWEEKVDEEDGNA